MNNGGGMSRGDRSRNAPLTCLREAVPVRSIVGIDLTDREQIPVVTDHDSKVLARRTFRCKAWGTRRGIGLGPLTGPCQGVRGRDGGV